MSRLFDPIHCSNEHLKPRRRTPTIEIPKCSHAARGKKEPPATVRAAHVSRVLLAAQYCQKTSEAFCQSTLLSHDRQRHQKHNANNKKSGYCTCSSRHLSLACHFRRRQYTSDVQYSCIARCHTIVDNSAPVTAMQHMFNIIGESNGAHGLDDRKQACRHAGRTLKIAQSFHVGPKPCLLQSSRPTSQTPNFRGCEARSEH
jgi:hypothetical protein